MIQPHPFLSELANLNGEDGLVDRFLIFTAKPEFHLSTTLKENLQKLQDTNMQSFEEVFSKIFTEHYNTDLEYRLSGEAESLYTDMIDQYATFVQQKYSDNEGMH
jgi:hypothetical protein